MTVDAFVRHRFSRAFLCIAGVCFSLLQVRGAALPNTTLIQTDRKKTAEAAVAHSVFNSDLSTAVDPFFPKSDRRPKPATPVVAVGLPDPSPAPTLMFPKQIVLQGISIAQNQKMALINGRTVAVGEDAVLKIDGEVLRLHCDEIRDRSVIVSIKGVTKEIRLREGL